MIHRCYRYVWGIHKWQTFCRKRSHWRKIRGIHEWNILRWEWKRCNKYWKMSYILAQIYLRNLHHYFNLQVCQSFHACSFSHTLSFYRVHSSRYPLDRCYSSVVLAKPGNTGIDDRFEKFGNSFMDDPFYVFTIT